MVEFIKIFSSKERQAVHTTPSNRNSKGAHHEILSFSARIILSICSDISLVNNTRNLSLCQPKTLKATLFISSIFGRSLSYLDRELNSRKIKPILHRVLCDSACVVSLIKWELPRAHCPTKTLLVLVFYVDYCLFGFEF